MSDDPKDGETNAEHDLNEDFNPKPEHHEGEPAEDAAREDGLIG